MKKKEWVAFMCATIEGIERHLRSSAPQNSRDQLKQFKTRTTLAQNLRARTRLEKDLDAFVESAPHLKDAANRHIADLGKPIIKASKRIVQMVERRQADRSKLTPC